MFVLLIVTFSTNPLNVYITIFKYPTKISLFLLINYNYFYYNLMFALLYKLCLVLVHKTSKYLFLNISNPPPLMLAVHQIPLKCFSHRDLVILKLVVMDILNPPYPYNIHGLLPSNFTSCEIKNFVILKRKLKLLYYFLRTL